MPIRLNLLAEAQAAEETRRRDPVKRACWGAGLFIAAMLAVSSLLELRVALAKSVLSGVEGQISAQTNSYKVVVENQRKAAEISQKLAALRQLSAGRLLYGSFLNSFQKATVDDVQLLHLAADQNYLFTEEVKAHTNDYGVVTKPKGATSTERIVVSLQGNDSSANPGDQVAKFKDVLANEQHFKQLLDTTNAINLKSISMPQLNPITGKSCVLFALECRLTEKTR